MTLRVPARGTTAVVLLALLALALIATGSDTAHAAPGVTTDKPDYVPTETVVITGTGFNPRDVLDVVVVRPDGAIVKGDGSGTSGWDTVTANGNGWFTYNYQLDGVVGIYRVQVYSSPWNGPESFDIPMTTTTFTDFTATSVTINGAAYSTPSLSVTLTVFWSGVGGDATQARFANDLTPENDCLDLGGGLYGPWQNIVEIGTSNTATFPHTLATQTDTGLRRVCAEVAQGVLGVPISLLPANDLIFYRVPNPPLTQSCGLDMVIVMDSSGSMDATELSQMKSALMFYTGAFLPETPTQIAIVEFDTIATITQPFTNNETALNNAINAATSGGTTNWDDALAKADSLFPNRPANPDLVVIASDGNPNTRGGHTHLGHNPLALPVSGQDAMSWASAEANDIRSDGTRIVALGIGDGLDTNNLITISGPVVSPPAPIDANVDVITTGFPTLAFSLAALADELCGGTITVHKVIDADGNTLTTGDQTNGPNFTFNTNVDPPDFSTPASGDTDGFGQINFDIDLGFNNAAVVDIIEPGEAGYTFISANCTKPDGPDPGTDPDPVGTPGSMAVNNIPVGELDIISCTFYNTSPPTADVKITSQTVNSPPSVAANTPFPISVQKTLHNNGPATPVTVSINPTVVGPPDCTITPAGGNPTTATLPSSVPTVVTENYTVTCTQPSTHQFSITNCISITSGQSDPNGANNCAPPATAMVSITATSDVKVQTVVTTAAPSANTGSPFAFSANADLHNNGPSGPTNVDTTFTLTLPPDCTTSSPNPVTIQNTMLGVSVVSAAPNSWTVTCTNPSSHSFTATASTAVDQLHVTDPNLGNNSGTSSPRNVNILATADVKVTAAVTTLPPSVTAGTPFTVNGSATLHNNGPYSPVNVDSTLTLSLPADCSTSSANPFTVQNTSLPMSTPTVVGASWSVTCTNPSNHNFSISASAAIDQLHILEGNAGNNSMNSPTATTAVNALSDVKVTTTSPSSPASFGAYAPFNVTGTATLHNNGPSGPTNVDTSFALTIPADCTTPSTNPQSVNNTSLPVSTAIVIPSPTPATWSVTCTDPGSHTFTVCAATVVDQLHVTDPNTANNSKCANTTTTIVPATITVCKDVIPNDSSVWDFTATGPTPAVINDLADGQCAVFHPNMIPGSYTVTEAAQGAYVQSVDCGSNGSQSDGDITFTLDPGEQVTCQYVNAFSPGPNPVGGVLGLIDDGDVRQIGSSHAGTGSSEQLPDAVVALFAFTMLLGLPLIARRLSAQTRRRRR